MAHAPVRSSLSFCFFICGGFAIFALCRYRVFCVTVLGAEAGELGF